MYYDQINKEFISPSPNIPNLEMQFPNSLAVNTLDEEVIDAMMEAGMTIFYLAIESGSPYTQVKIIKKHVNLDRARRLVEYANKRNLYTRCNFIIGFSQYISSNDVLRCIICIYRHILFPLSCSA